MKNILSILLILLLFSACQQTQRDRVADLIRKWEGKEILIPKGNDLDDGRTELRRLNLFRH